MKATFLMLASLVMLPGPALAQQDYLRSADANGDGALNETEFQTFIDILAETGRPKAQKVRRLADMLSPLPASTRMATVE